MFETFRFTERLTKFQSDRDPVSCLWWWDVLVGTHNSIRPSANFLSSLLPTMGFSLVCLKPSWNPEMSKHLEWLTNSDDPEAERQRASAPSNQIWAEEYEEMHQIRNKDGGAETGLCSGTASLQELGQEMIRAVVGFLRTKNIRASRTLRRAAFPVKDADNSTSPPLSWTDLQETGFFEWNKDLQALHALVVNDFSKHYSGSWTPQEACLIFRLLRRVRASKPKAQREEWVESLGDWWNCFKVAAEWKDAEGRIRGAYVSRTG